MAYITIPESDLDANSGLIESVTLQITRNFEDHEQRVVYLETYVGPETWTSKTSNYTLTTDDVNGNGFNTDGASGSVSFTLPAAQMGMKVTISVMESSLVTINTADGSDTIVNGEFGSPTTGMSCQTKGGTAILYGISNSEWLVITQGTWIGSGYLYIAGGSSGGNVLTCQQVNISGSGGSTNFGNMFIQATNGATHASSTRIVNSGGSTDTTQIQYGAIPTYAAWADFGNLTTGRSENAGGGNSTIAVFASSTSSDKITMASTGNATSFGSQTSSNNGNLCSNGTRLVIANGDTGGGPTNTLEYWTIATGGASTSYGTLSFTTSAGPGRADNATIGLFGGRGNGSPLSTTNSIVIATTGTGTSFGNLTLAGQKQGGSSPTTAIFSTGDTSGGGAEDNTLEKTTIGTTGTWSDFGNQTATHNRQSAQSNAHGGLNG